MTPVASHSPLRRFVTDGLRDTIDCYAAGTLPLHRFAWELDTRLATLAELTGLPHYRTLATLRAAQHAVATIDTELRATGRDGLTSAEEHTLAAATARLRTTLARLDPTDPRDPVDPTPVLVSIPSGHRAAAGHPGNRETGGHGESGGRRALVA